MKMIIFSLYNIILIGIFTVLRESQADITMEQVHKAGLMMRNICQPKNKVTDETLDIVRNGSFPDDTNLKCYVNCMFEMMQTMKKGKFKLDAALKQIDIMLPENLRESYRNGANACKDAGNGQKNPCDAAYTLLQCFYKNNPQMLFP